MPLGYIFNAHFRDTPLDHVFCAQPNSQISQIFGLSEKDCHKLNLQAISNSQPVRVVDDTFQAYLVYRGSFACGGTIIRWDQETCPNKSNNHFISDQWIQTAGHCVYEGLNTDPDPNVRRPVWGHCVQCLLFESTRIGRLCLESLMTPRTMAGSKPLRSD